MTETKLKKKKYRDGEKWRGKNNSLLFGNVVNLSQFMVPAFHLFASAEMNQKARAWNDNAASQTLFMARRNNAIMCCDRLGTDAAAFDTLATAPFLCT